MKPLASRTNWFVVAGILVLASVLRLIHLGHESLWLDEGWSVRYAFLDPVSMVGAAAHDVHPPLYYLLLHYWISLFGESEFAIRLMSVVFGTSSVLLIYLIALRLFDRRAAVVVAVLLSLSTFHIQYSQEARMYALLVFLILCSFFWFLRYLDNPSPACVVFYYFSSLLMVYTHVYGFFFLLVQSLYVFALFLLSQHLTRHHIFRWGLIQCVLLAGYLPWVSSLVASVRDIQGTYWITEPSLGTVWQTFKTFAGSSLLALVYFALSLLALFEIRRKGGSIRWRDFLTSVENQVFQVRFARPRTLLFLGIWLSIPLLAPYLISRVAQPVYLIRGTIGASLAWYFLVARGFTSIHQRNARIIAGVLIVTLMAGSLWQYYREDQKEPWREIVNYVENRAEPGDLVLNCPAFVYKSRICFYYSSRTDLDYSMCPLSSSARPYSDLPEAEVLLQALGQNKRAWVLLYKIDTSEVTNAIRGSGYRVSDVATFRHRISVILLQEQA